jgi:membrane fusion protein, multidrug efflux system
MADAVELERQPGREDSEPNKPVRRSWFREHPRAIWVILALLVLIAVGAYRVWLHFSVRESTDDAQIEGHITPTSPRVGGTVLSVKVNDNQYVEAGTVLVQIDPRDYQVAVQRAEADLAAAQAAVIAGRQGVPITTTTTASQTSSARAGVDEARASFQAAEKQVDVANAQLHAAQARVREVQANYEKAARDLDRMKQLVARDEISRQQYDSAVAAAEATRATVDSARASVAQSEQGVQVANAQVAQARARMEQARAGVEATRSAPQQIASSKAQVSSLEAKVEQNRAAVVQAQINLEYTTVKAPASGLVSKKTAEPGQVVAPGQPLMAIVPLEDVWVIANFKETQLKDMRPGQSAVISVDAYGGREYRGHVDSIAGATGARFSLLPPENATGNYVKVVQRVPVKIVFERGQDPQHLLRPGMSVTPTVYTGR